MRRPSSYGLRTGREAHNPTRSTMDHIELSQEEIAEIAAWLEEHPEDLAELEAAIEAI